MTARAKGGLFYQMIGAFDRVYFFLKHKCLRAGPRLFHKGWGSDAAIRSVVQRFARPGSACAIDVEWESDWIEEGGHKKRFGRFQSPLYRDHLPEESRNVYFEFVLPCDVRDPAVVLVMPTTGEQGYRSREVIGRRLARLGIGSVMVEGPFMGARKPRTQIGTTLAHLSDFFLLCGASIEEGRALLTWLRESGFTNLTIAGVSKGGYIAAVAGSFVPFDVAIVTLVAPHSGKAVFIDGLTRLRCDWEAIRQTYPGSDHSAEHELNVLFDDTSLERIPQPGRGKVTISIGAYHDYFVPRQSYEVMENHWPSARWRWLAGGHVSSIVVREHFFAAIFDAVTGLHGMASQCRLTTPQ